MSELELNLHLVDRYPRWDVMPDATAFYMFRNMLGLPKKEVNEFVDYDYLGIFYLL